MKQTTLPKTIISETVLASPISATVSISLEKIIVFSLILYLPFHLLEEWAFGFPAWAEAYWHIPNYTVAKWLFHNVYFSAFLLIGFCIYRLNRMRFLPLGLGIVIWGLMNAVNHLTCSLVFLEYEPGIVTGLLWFPLATAAYRALRVTGLMSYRLITMAFLAALLAYWSAPIFLFIYVDKLLGW